MSQKYMWRSALIAVAWMAQAARAQPADSEADRLFHEAIELRKAGRIAEACAVFDASQKASPATETVLNQAHCRELNGQLATARSLFVDAARQTASLASTADQQMHETATDRAARLQSRLSTLRIVAPAGGPGVSPAWPLGLEVLRDGVLVEPSRWNQPMPIDGGTYRITARAPGRVEWSTTVTIATEHDTRVVEIPELRATEPVRPALATWSTRRKLAAGLAGGGVLALGVGSVLGVVAKVRQSDAHALCPDPAFACNDAERANQLIDKGHRYANGANAAFGVAAAVTVTAVVLWISGAPESHRLAVVPVASPGQLAITASGRF